MNDQLRADWDVSGKGALEKEHRGTSEKLRADVLSFMRAMGEPVHADEIAEACGSPAMPVLKFVLNELVNRGGVVCKHNSIGNVYMLRGSDADARTDDDDEAVDQVAATAALDPVTREPTPTPQEAARKYGALQASVLDCFLGATKPLSSGDIRAATSLSVTQVNGALTGLKRAGQIKRYGENVNSRWVHSNAPQAILSQLPSEISGIEHGIEPAVQRGVHQPPEREHVPTHSTMALAEAVDPVEAPRDDAATPAVRPDGAAISLTSHIATVMIDVDELLSDAIGEQAAHAALAHIQRAARELRLALAISKGA